MRGVNRRQSSASDKSEWALKDKGRTMPFKLAMARSASSTVRIVTKPNPRER